MTRKAYSFRVVGSVFFALIALGIATGAAIYFHYLRYVPVAAAHVPLDSDAVVRVEVEKVVLFDPVRKYVFPIVDCAGSPKMKPTRHERIQGRSRVELAVDLREIVYAQAGSSSQWVLLLGGMFPKSGVVEGMAKVLREEGRKGSVEDGVWVDAKGWALGQAQDGVVVLASNAERARAALPVGSAATSLGLPKEGAVAFALARPALDRLTGAAGIPPLRGVTSVHGHLGLSGDVTGHAVAGVSPGADAAQEKPQVEASLRALAARPAEADVAGEGAVAAQAKVRVASEGLVVDFPWQLLDSDRGGGKLEALLSQRLCGEPP
ncbi:MAG: hypothetical protein KC776_13225 [Myxococcales bacterium]|nr:hypothetical protein [Myxococcales bacterium]MCB9580793.1 hypothetical protein [Polyangiaceae bacterium]